MIGSHIHTLQKGYECDVVVPDVNYTNEDR